MTDHLPECIFKPEYVDSAKGIRWGGRPCICDELRACEQRVLSLNPVALGVLIAQRARERALDAAREAVAAIPADYKIRGEFETYSPYAEGRSDFKDGALAAIDRLREEEK